MIPDTESDRFSRPGTDYAAVVYSHNKGKKIDLSTFKLFPSMDNAKMRFLATHSPLNLLHGFD